MKGIGVQYCGIALLILLVYLTFKRRPIKLRSTKAFYFALLLGLACLILDANSLLVITHAQLFPDWLCDFFCKCYIVTLPWVGFSALNYLVVENYRHRGFDYVFRLGGLVAFVSSVAIFRLPIYRFYEGDQIYTYGPAVVCTYAFTGAFIVITVVFALVFRSQITPLRRGVVLFWMGLILVAATIQFFNNQYLLVGFAISLGLTSLFGELEDPASYIDEETGLYSAAAARRLIAELYSDGKVFCGMTVIATIEDRDIPREVELEVLASLGSYIKTLGGAGFRISQDEFAMVFDRETNLYEILYEVQVYVESITDRGGEYSKIQGVYFVLPDSSKVDSALDVIRLHRYLAARDDLQEVNVVTDDTVRIVRRLDKVKEQITSALAENRVEVFYQPIYDTRTDTFVSAEALVRIRREDGSMMSPGEFIPVAEETGLVTNLGEEVFRQTCELISNYDITELGLRYVEINLSTVQCEQKGLYEKFQRIMRKNGVSPEQINLEITETAPIRASKMLAHNMEKLVGEGVRFSLDDFGTGHSNLDYIMSLPVDIIKIDRVLTASYFESDRVKNIFHHIVPMVQKMGMEIVVEGVETEEQLNAMRKLGVEHIQGFYFSKPVPREVFLAFLKKRNLGRVEQ